MARPALISQYMCVGFYYSLSTDYFICRLYCAIIPNCILQTVQQWIIIILICKFLDNLNSSIFAYDYCNSACKYSHFCSRIGMS